jgi:hypothetical protein
MSRLLRNAYRRTRRVTHTHGVLGTMQLAVEKLRLYVSALGSRNGAGSEPKTSFDQVWNVRTDGNEDLSKLRLVDDTNYVFGTRYQATAPETFAEVIRACPLPADQCIFIDCGSGKGRVLLMASELPFRKIIGIEFATDLADIARANIDAYRSPTQRCRDIEVACVDATRFAFPAEPTVLYLYNPFTGPVMEQFVKQVEASLREHPRPFVVLYRNARFAKCWDQSPSFVKIASSALFVAYRARTTA